MRRPTPILVVLVAGATWLACGHSPAQERGVVDLLDVELVARLDGKIGEGPFDSTSAVDRRVVRKIGNCIDAVRQIALRWGDAQRMVLSNESRGANHLTLLFEPPVAQGVFEILYRVDVAAGRAHGRFRYYDRTGTARTEPTSGQRAFGKELLQAMSCADS